MNLKSRVERLEDASDGAGVVTLEEMVAHSYRTDFDPAFELRLARSGISRQFFDDFHAMPGPKMIGLQDGTPVVYRVVTGVPRSPNEPPA
jgi:hypothetical protein